MINWFGCSLAKFEKEFFQKTKSMVDRIMGQWLSSKGQPSIIHSEFLTALSFEGSTFNHWGRLWSSESPHEGLDKALTTASEYCRFHGMPVDSSMETHQTK